MGAPNPRAPGSRYETVTVDAEDSAPVVFFSSVSENTRRFVDKLHLPALRIPLRPAREGMIRVCRPYVLFAPTYGGGKRAAAVPKQVVHFLNDPVNRGLLRGVIPSGNRNFGVDYCRAGPIISRKCGVPELHRYELIGTSLDVSRVRDIMTSFLTETSSLPLGAP
ncbi:class Ib ribonucleoside-diphosphate reductase assembly flavoprotein NrdI [Corynebacterium yudongzhengii]|uniref:Protein NrdI n=1 Tax=Corynebacterium yudongzhengii TaxID=2080740 RepID=A0A2U1T543_9CORY|nr:class Ib ribonucleoside-diphosphate reductase assembly flavoprotein NrdI [Corynebacterium yudongzhengii]AWB81407.1 class Ib ribonucleoside-diphosphate reductase assembly flavoprotein NrdI [Corynebacterium yudongzhengii]PWC01095.1 class Ib ribonucleoside-diphosphate reductase assembly flavoprotein NrdI [Corynebacterium yudongzhengii]